MALKTEAMGDVQRGGPSTGLPTKTEQADLLQAVYGINSEAPIPVLADSSPTDCFDTTYEAARIALKYMTPVIVLTDGYIANGAESWRIPKIDDLIDLTPKFETNPENFQPYSRDPVTLARPWAIPGTPGLEHKIGGLEKENLSGNISYDPANHDYMVKIRAKKVENIANDINTAVHNMRSEGLSVSHLHLRYLNPLPENVGQILNNFKQILVPEINLG